MSRGKSAPQAPRITASGGTAATNDVTEVAATVAALIGAHGGGARVAAGREAREREKEVAVDDETLRELYDMHKQQNKRVKLHSTTLSILRKFLPLVNAGQKVPVPGLSRRPAMRGSSLTVKI